MSQPIHHFFIRGEGCFPVGSAALPSAVQLRVYEVLRVAMGIPIFQEAHLSRLRRSVELAGRHWAMSDPAVGRALRELIFCNEVRTGNIRLELTWLTDDPGEAGELAAFFVPHTYPSPEQIRRGVPLGSIYANRRLPNAKVEQRHLRERADALLREKNLYEVLLIDPQDRITEGSRSNFFMIRNKEVLTPPLTAVLPGITRGEVVRLCRLLVIPLRETDLPLAWLSTVDAAFITGTSPGVLPVANIGTHSFQVDHPLLQTLRTAYEERVRNYLARRRSASRPAECG